MTFRENEFRRVQREVADLNKAAGRRGMDIPEDQDGWAVPAADPNEVVQGQPTSFNGEPPTSPDSGEPQNAQDVGPNPLSDPGPPRLIGVNLDARLAIMAGGAGVELTQHEVLTISTICLEAVYRQMNATVRQMAELHGVKIIEQPDPRRNGAEPVEDVAPIRPRRRR